MIEIGEMARDFYWLLFMDYMKRLKYLLMHTQKAREKSFEMNEDRYIHKSNNKKHGVLREKLLPIHVTHEKLNVNN